MTECTRVRASVRARFKEMHLPSPRLPRSFASFNLFARGSWHVDVHQCSRSACCGYCSRLSEPFVMNNVMNMAQHMAAAQLLPRHPCCSAELDGFQRLLEIVLYAVCTID